MLPSRKEYRQLSKLSCFPHALKLSLLCNVRGQNRVIRRRIRLPESLLSLINAAETLIAIKKK